MSGDNVLVIICMTFHTSFSADTLPISPPLFTCFPGVEVSGTDIQVILGLPSYLSCVNTCKSIGGATAAVHVMGVGGVNSNTSTCSCRYRAFFNKATLGDGTSLIPAAVKLDTSNASTTCLYGSNTPEKPGERRLFDIQTSESYFVSSPMRFLRVLCPR